MATGLGPADGLEPLLAVGVLWVREHPERAIEQTFNLGNRDAMLLAFFLVPAIPFESDDPLESCVEYVYSYT